MQGLHRKLFRTGAADLQHGPVDDNDVAAEMGSEWGGMGVSNRDSDALGHARATRKAKRVPSAYTALPLPIPGAAGTKYYFDAAKKRVGEACRRASAR